MLDSGDRTSHRLPVETVFGLAQTSDHCYFVVGGEAAVPPAKLTEHALTPAGECSVRIGGADRWETLRFIGQYATQFAAASQ